MAPDEQLRRRILGWGLAGVLAPQAVLAQDDRPIEWVVGYAAGGGSDAVARVVAESMSRSLQRRIVVVNKPGAATNIAADYVAKSKDLGHVMLTADFATLAANPALFSKLPYDPEKDFAPVGMLGRFPMMLVVAPSVPARSFQAFLAWARKRPGGTSYASAGTGSPHHLAAELLRERTGLVLTHIPYRGAAPALQDLLGGQVAFMMVDTASVMPYVTSGRLKAIAIASAARHPLLPEVATLAEQGLKDFEAYAWQGLVVPAQTPPATTEAFHRALLQALGSESVLARLNALGVEPLAGTPAAMSAYIRSERERWGRLIRDNHIKLD